MQDLVCQEATDLGISQRGDEVRVDYERSVRGDPRRRHTVLGVSQAGPKAEGQVAEERNACGQPHARLLDAIELFHVLTP